MKKTPIYDAHLRAGGKMIDFSGWQLPVQFEGLKREHLWTRTEVGLFDVSHMGEIWVKGPKALETLQWVTSNNVERLEPGQAQYTLLMNSQGGIVDDLIVYCLKKNDVYLLCVNAANIEKDEAHLRANNQGAEIENVSEQWAQLAVQGPKAAEVLLQAVGLDISEKKPFTFLEWSFEGANCFVAMTGYTGESGVEIFVPNEKADQLWEALMKEERVKPVGLGARDTLRLEKKYPLYGQELGDNTNAYEAGLGWVVKPAAKDFLGKSALLEAREMGLKKKMVGLEILGRGIARTGYKLFSFDNKEVGAVTSGTQSPSLNKAIALAFVDKDLADVGSRFNVEIRGKMVEAQVVKTPFVG